MRNINSIIKTLLNTNHYIRYWARKLKANFIWSKEILESFLLLFIKKKTVSDASEFRIDNWKKFATEVRANSLNLLAKLDNFPNSILIAGCQRSGTTMLSRVIGQSGGMVDYRYGRDDELDAALILSGVVSHKPKGRYCFQTTYLNENVHEYYCHLNGEENHKLIWLIRNPLSVVYSMLFNWEDYALNELFEACGISFLNRKQKHKYNRFGSWSISRLEKACYSYNGKTSQLFQLNKELTNNRFMVLEYEHLVQKKNMILPLVFEFVNLPYRDEYSEGISSISLNKLMNLSDKQRLTIENMCMPIYKNAKKIVTIKL